MNSIPQPSVIEKQKSTPIWKNPGAWLREQKLSRSFWIFFTAAFFFDFGFAVYAFMFNLYLLDRHFDERAIGLIGGAATLGSVAATLPVGFLARKTGLRPLLLVCFVAAPVLNAVRTLVMGESAQIALAFITGLSMCLWAVCFLPVIAGTTTEENRASAFSLIFSAAIGTSTLGGVICGYLPQWLKAAGFVMQPAAVKQLILLSSCAIAAVGIFAVLRLRLSASSPLSPIATQPDPQPPTQTTGWLRGITPQPFLLRFLPSMALWTVVLASFAPFANVYLSRELHIPLLRIGLVFSAAQIVQFAVGLLTPLLFRAFGLVNGIVATQIATAAAMFCLAGTHASGLAIAFYLTFSGMQWMASPGLYNLLMSKVPEEQRSTASGMTMFCNAIVQSGATAGAGILFARFGYPPVMVGIAVTAMAAALLFRALVGPLDRKDSKDRNDQANPSNHLDNSLPALP